MTGLAGSGRTVRAAALALAGALVAALPARPQSPADSAWAQNPAGSAPSEGPADSAWRRGDLPRAERLYEAQLALEAPSERALHRLALMRAWAERYEESLELFDRLLREAPANVEAALDRALVLSWIGELDRAIAAHEAVLEAHPGHRGARLGLARVLSWRGDLDAAAAVYRGVLAETPDDPEARAGEARVLAWQGHLATAERRWRAALELHPGRSDLWLGLGRTLRWQGRPAEAVAALERAAELAPDPAEAREELRLARLPFAPRAAPAATWEADSDGNRILTVRHEQVAWPSRSVAIAASGRVRTAELGAETATTLGGWLETRWRVAGGWELDLGAGVADHDRGDAGPRAEWTARAATPGHLPVQAWARIRRRGLLETVPLMRADVRIEELDLGVRGSPAPGWRGSAAIGRAELEGTSRNRRWSGRLDVARRLGGAWSAGVSVRAFGYREDAADGYFDPELYALAEARVGWSESLGPWRLAIDAAPGLQTVRREASRTAGSARAGLSIGHALGPGRAITLHAALSTTGLQSFATGEADYRYASVGLSAEWAF